MRIRTECVGGQLLRTLVVDDRRSLSMNWSSTVPSISPSVSVVICVVADSVPGFSVATAPISNERSECNDTFRLFGNMSAFVSSLAVCVAIVVEMDASNSALSLLDRSVSPRDALYMDFRRWLAIWMVCSMDLRLDVSSSSSSVSLPCRRLCFDAAVALDIGRSSENDTFFGVRSDTLSELAEKSRLADDWLSLRDGFTGDESRLPLAFRDTGVELMTASPNLRGGRAGCSGSEQSLNLRLSHFTA